MTVPAVYSGGDVIDSSARPAPIQDWEWILRHAERFRRSADALKLWSDKAKVCVDMFEGKQWSETDLRALEDEGRPALVINKIRPLVRLVLGYFLNNQTDITFSPGNDGTGTADTARVLSQVAKQISQINELPFVDAEVFLDGLLCGRGYFDHRLDFDRNMFGEVAARAEDPFTVYLDPDGSEYDLNRSGYYMRSRFISADEVEHFYGQNAANLIRPLTNGLTFNQFPSSLYEGADEVTPWRRFGGDIDSPNNWSLYTEQFYNWVDTYRKTIRMVDIEHYIRVDRWFFVDLETGDSKAVPDDWGPDRVQRVLAWAKANGEPLILQRKKTRRLRWTHMVGDIIVFDEWSPYDTMTLTPFFPYFRRGMTMGMVEPLLDPQREINVRRSARQNIIGRSSNGGWVVHEGALTPQGEQNLEANGSRPGFILKWNSKNNTVPEPKQIQPHQSPVSVEQLEKEAEADIKQIAGINDSALGQVDQSTLSGVAIQARQQQTVIGLEQDLKNWHRTKRMCGSKQLEIVQSHYTEQRIIRVLGKNESDPVSVVINQKTAAGLINDITVGRYSVAIDETSLSKSFIAGQFKELTDLKQLGLPIPDGYLIDASSIGRKEELRADLAQAREQQAQQAAQAAAAGGAAPGGPPQGGGGPGGSRQAPDGSSLPSGPEPGAPPLPSGIGHPASPPIAQH